MIVSGIKFSPAIMLRVELQLEGVQYSVGRLAWRDRQIFFEYDNDFRSSSLELSPFKLPLFSHLTEGPSDVFEGLHGLFNDSLPDGWGRLLLDRKLRELGGHPNQLTPLDRLAWIGNRGMGALSYVPEHQSLIGECNEVVDLDRLSEEAGMVLENSPEAVLDELLAIGGSPQGARPKALVGISPDGSRLIHGVDDLPEGWEHWIVKFRAYSDPLDAGAVERAYAVMAGVAGIDMPPTALLPSARGQGYFAIKRFDRDGGHRHMHTVSGLLNIDHRLPSLGYEGLLKLTRALVRNEKAVDQMFTRMVFNVLAHNQDDHTKNHSFLMEGDGTWSVSPAYDVTFSSGPGGEHALDVAGMGRNPGVDHILAVAKNAGVTRKTAEATISRVRDAVDRWPDFAAANGVDKKTTSTIDMELNGRRNR